MTSSIAGINWHDMASSLIVEGRAYIDGQFCHAASGETLWSVNPATDRPLAQVAACGTEDVDRAVAAARRAFVDSRWRGLPRRTRKRVLLDLSRLMLAHRRELALLESLDMGKPVREAYAVDVPFAAECIAWYAETIDKSYDEIAPVDDPVTALIRREPLGVVAAVTPWNFPLLMACWKIAPALALGNSVVAKPSERAPLSLLRFAALAHEAGLPSGVLNIVPGLGDVAGRALGEHPDVDCLAFTGSTDVGKRFLAYSAASNLKAIWPECGGKSAQLVFADSDLDAAARGVVDGIFYNQGEVCNAGSRLLVQEECHEALLRRIVGHVERISVGDPLDPDTRCGPLVDAAHASSVLRAIDDALNEGAILLTGGVGLKVDGAGAFVAPTVFDRVTPEMTAWKQEIFGPVLAVASFRTEADAIRLANDNPYALAAGLWTRDVARINRLTGALRAGTVWVNSYDRHAMSTPFGGFGLSGYGRDRSLHALDKYSGLKTIWNNAA